MSSQEVELLLYPDEDDLRLDGARLGTVEEERLLDSDMEVEGDRQVGDIPDDTTPSLARRTESTAPFTRDGDGLVGEQGSVTSNPTNCTASQQRGSMAAEEALSEQSDWDEQDNQEKFVPYLEAEDKKNFRVRENETIVFDSFTSKAYAPAVAGDMWAYWFRKLDLIVGPGMKDVQAMPNITLDNVVFMLLHLFNNADTEDRVFQWSRKPNRHEPHSEEVKKKALKDFVALVTRT